MTTRSIYAGLNPTVIIKAATTVTVEGWDSDQVQAATAGRGGLKIGMSSEAELARARAVVGNTVLFDVRLKRPGGKRTAEDAIEVEIGGEGSVYVPLGSHVKVFAGANAKVSGMRGSAAVFAGGNVAIEAVRALAPSSAGGAFELACETVEGDEIKFEAGRDLSCYIRGLTSARVMVNDLGGYWEGVIGDGKVTLRLKAGGDATLVTDQKVEAAPPYYVLGQIKRPVVSENAA